jgi:cell division protease FtsH
MDVLHAMKDALMEYETIDSEQVDDLMERRPVRPPHDWQDGDFGGWSGGSSGGDEPDDSGGQDAVGGPAKEH